jgi:hypothetical protein
MEIILDLNVSHRLYKSGHYYSKCYKFRYFGSLHFFSEEEQFVERAIFILKLNQNMLLYMFLSIFTRSGYNYSANLLIHNAFQHLLS